MKTKSLTLAVFLFLAFTAKPQTSQIFHETFESNDETGWSFLAYNASIAVADGSLTIQSTDDFTIHIFPPVEATENDFSLKVSGGGNLAYAGGIGRQGLDSYLGIHVEDDSLFVIYAEHVEYYPEPNFIWSEGFKVPENATTLQLDATRSGSNLIVNAYVNGINFYSGTLTNVYEGLLYGRPVLYTVADNDQLSFSLDEIEIHYNPYNATKSSFTDEFDFEHSPWMKFGDLVNVPQSITISGSGLNFGYSGSEETALFVIPPVSSVGNFSVDLDGGITGEHNTYFGLSRFYDYTHYVTSFVEDNTVNIGYANGSPESTVLQSVVYDPASINQFKFSVEKAAADLILTTWVNNELLLTGTLVNAPSRLLYGQLTLGFDRGTIVNASFEKADFVYTPFSETTSDPENDLFSKRESINILPNPLISYALLQFSQNLSNARLEVYDIHRNKLRSMEALTGRSFLFQREDLPSGMYFLRLWQNNALIAIQKMMVGE